MATALTVEAPQEATSKLVARTMGRARDFKQRADTALEELFRSLFEEIDTVKLSREIDALKAASPDYQPAELARQLTRRTAIRCAAAGAVTGLPSGLAALGTLGADLAYLMYQQFRLILGIATIYGHEPTGRERFTEAISCLALTSGIGLGKSGIATMLGAVTLEGGLLAEKIGARFVRDRVARVIPFVGVFSGGALNYVSVKAVSRTAIKYYASRIDGQLADEIWAEGDREHA